ncbi:hypothetical protein PIB30_114169, partial [Stylosanthes scabra]|nr:hypothetical protein [Stylosanthes scabra]
MDDDRTKDNDKARLDLEELCRRPELHLRRLDSGRFAKPKAAFALTHEQRQNGCRWLQ